MSSAASATPLVPRSPLGKWPVQEFDPRYGFAWWLGDSRWLVTQTTVPQLGRGGASVLHDWIDAIIETEDIPGEPARPMSVIHDWRSLVDYESRTRKYFMLRMRNRRPDYLRKTYIAVDPRGSFLRMAIETGNLFATLVLKAQIHIETRGFSHVLASENIRLPSTRLPFPRLL